MSTLHMMVGLSGSGKSTKARELAEAENAIILSSDELRQKILDDVNDQSQNSMIFERMFKYARKHLDNGENVIIDATNTNRKRRISALKRFAPEHKKIAHLMVGDIGDALVGNANRDRKVPAEVIERQYKNFEFPILQEGFDNIIMYRRADWGFAGEDVDFFEDALIDGGYHDIFGGLNRITNITCNLIDVPQDNPHHTFSVSRHTYYVLESIREMFGDNMVMLWTALFHDFGKPFCKTFTDYRGQPTRYAHFAGHENVSWQNALNMLMAMGYGSPFCYEVAKYVGLHMRLLHLDGNDKAIEAFKNLVGDRDFDILQKFQMADVNAK